jgi:lipid-binding SYLF domain-containing protein
LLLAVNSFCLTAYRVPRCFTAAAKGFTLAPEETEHKERFEMTGNTITRRALLALGLGAGLAFAGPGSIAAASEAERTAINAAADLALQQLYGQNGNAKTLADKAAAVLVFPKITKAGLGIGGEAGKGVLRKGGESVAYYRTRSISFGLQAGAQTYGYVLMFMTENALAEFMAKNGYEIGVDGSVAVLDKGVSAGVDTNSIKADAIAIVFNESGLMYNLAIEGSKIQKLDI